MRKLNVRWSRWLHAWGLVAGVAVIANSSLAQEPEATISEPGFRPGSEYAATFVEAASNARIAVLPTIIRRADRTAHSFSSRQQIVAFLNESGIATPVTKPLRIDLGPLRRPSQWEIFQSGAQSVAERLGGYETGADYTLIMELLVPGDESVFGIEVYIVDRQGRDAFSFLLNSHHQLFAEASLATSSSSEAARSAMIEKATAVGLEALAAQLRQARECIGSSVTAAPITPSGIFRDFEEELVAGTDAHGISLGFSTFSDGKSPVSIALTDDHPFRPGETGDNQTLELFLDVQNWAGIVDIFHNNAVDTWTTFDWSDLDGFSFWLYGNNSGTRMFVDVIDNRNPCSLRDDAERYTYEFWDDVPGWRLIKVPFADMARKEIYNGAPNDGLDLANVHGWGIGAGATGGPITFYVDEFQLWKEPSNGHSPTGEKISHRLFVETRIDEFTSRIIVVPDQQAGLVVDKVMDLMCETANLTSERGFRYFRMDERAMLSGGRAMYRLTFYLTPPEGLTVAGPSNDADLTRLPDLMTAVLDAKQLVESCSLLGARPRDPN